MYYYKIELSHMHHVIKYLITLIYIREVENKLSHIIMGCKYSIPLAI